MGPKESELVKVIKEHADEDGRVRGNQAVVREWIGPHASEWDIHGMLVELKRRGEIPSNTYVEGLGDFEMTFPS